MNAQLPIRQVAKPWGKCELPAPFGTREGERIGEIWFEPPQALPELLVKYIFTSEPLSVQVHPSDNQTVEKGLGKQGKEECWLILAAEEGAKLGIGFDEPLSADEMREAAMDGSIEQKMTWHTVSPGDFFYIPANTVHAIGAGVSLIEVQQNSDITYRLYDYNRPRELHLDEGMAIAKGEPYVLDQCHMHVSPGISTTLVKGPLFQLDQVVGPPGDDVAARYSGKLLVIPCNGDVTIGSEVIAPGSCGFAEALSEVMFSSDGVCLVAAPHASER